MGAQWDILAVYIFAGIVGTSIAVSVVGIGSCPSPNTQPSFNIDQYLGTWYEYERFPNWFEYDQDCVKAVYGDNGDGTYRVANTGAKRAKFLGLPVYSRERTMTGIATIPDASKPAELRVDFRDGSPKTNPNYRVLDTDYISYAVVYNCIDVVERFPLNIQFLWVLTRVRGVAPIITLNLVKNNIAQSGIRVEKLERTDQFKCK